VKLELRFSVWVTRNWPGTGSDFQNQNQLGQKTVFNPIPGLGWNENIERYLPDTVSIRLGCSKANTRPTLAHTMAK
jgi:hypothetical protein